MRIRGSQTGAPTPEAGAGRDEVPDHVENTPAEAAHALVDELMCELAGYLERTVGDPEAVRLRRKAENIALLLQLTTGREPAYPAPLDVGDLLMSLLPVWQAQASLHTFELALLGEMPSIIADAQRVRLAIDRLLAAVVRATPGGTTVRVSVRPGEGDEVVVSVRHADLARRLGWSAATIFETTTAETHGAVTAPNAALDLTLARMIVQEHGGRLWVDEHADVPRRGLALQTAWPLVPPVTRARAEAVAGHQAGSAIGPTLAGPALERALVAREECMILVVEAEPRMARFLKANVEAHGHRAVVAHEVAAARRLADLEAPDLVLLDGGLAGDERLDPLRRLIADSGCPVLVLARRSDPMLCAQALDLGAADWLVRPFSMPELLARIRSALRWRSARSGPGPQANEGALTCGELTIDCAQRLVSVAGKAVALSKTEYKLLCALADHPGMVLAHEALLERVWGPGYGDAVEFVWVYVRRLRCKIEPDPAHPRFILTVPGVGYRLASN